jgi:hypothetical protein
MPAKPQSTAAPQATAAPKPTKAPSSTGKGIEVLIQAVGYEKWGRPMSKQYCGDFNDADPIRKFNVSMRVTNHTSDILVEWYAAFFVGMAPAYRTCYYGYSEGPSFPSMPPGESRDVTFAAFVENDQAVTSVIVGGQGTLTKVCFEGMVVKPCLVP